MRDYQSKKDKMPHDEYMATLWYIRGYDRRKAEADAILNESPAPPDGMPRGMNTSDEVAEKAEKREALLRDNDIVLAGIRSVPEEYRSAIWNNVMYHTKYPWWAACSTFSVWRRTFIRTVYEMRNN